MASFEYFEKDGAVFRRQTGYAGVQDIQSPNGEWKPYAGDRMAPVNFGDEISAEQAGEA